MVKTKTRSRVKTKPVVDLTEKSLGKKSNTACNSSCWLCSIFKLMVVVFVVLIIFWLGFCFGDLSVQSFRGISYRAMSINKPSCIKDIKSGNLFCAGAPVNQSNSSTTSTLTNKTGDDFDKEFLLEMTVNHQATLEMAKLALTNSSRDDIKTLAQQIIDSQTKDIEQMKAWQTEWFTIK